MLHPATVPGAAPSHASALAHATVSAPAAAVSTSTSAASSTPTSSPSVPSTQTFVWTNRTTPTHPSPRASAMMAYDPSLGSVVLFGGWNGSSVYNDTWTYRAGVWTQLALTHAPAQRMGGNLVWDATDGYLVLFGGWNWTGYFNDTWKFSGGAWTLLHPTVSPPARDLAGMTWDAGDGYILLFSGLGTGSTNLNDTWSFLGGNWTKHVTPPSLPPRNGPGMAYDALDGYVVMLQGEGTQYYQDLWKYQGGFWTQLSGGVPISSRDGAALVYDPAANYTLYFAGEHLGTYLNETWTYTGGTLTQLHPPIGPVGTQYVASTFDVADNYVLSFGGAVGPRVVATTWAWSTPLPLTLFASISPTVRTTVGSTVAYTAYSSGGMPVVSVAWQFGDGVSVTGGRSTHAYAWPGNYTINCTVTDGIGRTATASFPLRVTWGAGTPIVVTITSPSSPPSGPAPLAVSFSGFATGGYPGYIASWNFGDGSAPASGWNVTSYTYPTPGTYTATLTATDRAGRTGASSIVVTVGPHTVSPLTASASATPTSGTAPLTVAFTSTAQGGVPGYTFLWNFGDGTSASSENTTHTFQTAGSWPVTLTVTDSANPAHSASKVVDVTVQSAGGNSTAPPTGILGLPGNEGLFVIAGVLAVVVVVAVLAVLLLRRKPPHAESMENASPYAGNPYPQQSQRYPGAPGYSQGPYSQGPPPSGGQR